MLSNALTFTHSGKVRSNGRQVLVLKLSFWDCSKKLITQWSQISDMTLVYPSYKNSSSYYFTKPSDLKVYPYTLHTAQVITPNSAENAAIVGGLIFYHIFPNNLLQWIKQLLLIFLILSDYTDGPELKIWVAIFTLLFYCPHLIFVSYWNLKSKCLTVTYCCIWTCGLVRAMPHLGLEFGPGQEVE